MKKASFILVIVFGFAVQGWGQENGHHDIIYASKKSNNPLFDSLNAPIKHFHRILSAHDPIMYLGFVNSFKPASDRLVPLEDREGKQGYYLEGDMNYRFTLYKGAYYSYPFPKRLRVTFDAGFTVRMTQDSSSPLLPSNNRFGLGVDYSLTDIEENARSPFHAWLTFQVHHYSNGQADNDFHHHTGLRNNYIDGDFSSNYVRGLVYGAKEVYETSVVSAGLGYQRDTDLLGPLILSDDMKNGSYGQNRLLLNLQYLRMPSFDIVERDDRQGFRTFAKVTRLAFRSEMSFIIDNDLHKITANNKKYRFGINNSLTWFPFEKANVGAIVKYYYGRDYLNIRFDDVIHAAQVGITVDFNRY